MMLRLAMETLGHAPGMGCQASTVASEILATREFSWGRNDCGHTGSGRAQSSISRLFSTPSDTQAGRHVVCRDVVRQSHNPDFVGMEVKFILHLEQDSDGHLSGNGRKALVNGALPPPVEISSLAVQKGSSVSGSDVRISFVEGNDARPERRNLVGTFVWSIVDKDTLVGTFDTAAAGSSGDSRARRGRC